jgi:GTP-binding protein
MIIRSIFFPGSAVRREQYPRDGKPEIVVAGRSNVGKSSFINALLNNGKVARVSKTPGKTRLLNFFLINEEFWLLDVPGYGYAAAPKNEVTRFAELLDEYFGTPRNRVCGILLLDIRRTPAEDDMRMIDYYASHGIPTHVVLTKADKLSGNERTKRTKAIREALPAGLGTPIVYSAKTKENVPKIWSVLEAHLPGGARP